MIDSNALEVIRNWIKENKEIVAENTLEENLDDLEDENKFAKVVSDIKWMNEVAVDEEYGRFDRVTSIIFKINDQFIRVQIDQKLSKEYVNTYFFTIADFVEQIVEYKPVYRYETISETN